MLNRDGAPLPVTEDLIGWMHHDQLHKSEGTSPRALKSGSVPSLTKGAVVGRRAHFPADWVGLLALLLGLWVSVCSQPWRDLHTGTQQGESHTWVKQHN